MKFYYVGGATCVLDIGDQVKIAIDPALMSQNKVVNFKGFDSVRKDKPVYTDELMKSIDLWLITHAHKDHLDENGIKAISSSSQVVCDSVATSEMIHNTNTHVLKWGEKYNFSKNSVTIEVTAVPAFHASTYLVRKLVGKVNGYIVKIVNGEEILTVYFTGDTVYHKKVCSTIPKNIDLMVANLGNVRSQNFGGPLTMNLDMLRKFDEELKPRNIIPVHVDCFSHYETTKSEVEKAGYKILATGQCINF